MKAQFLSVVVLVLWLCLVANTGANENPERSIVRGRVSGCDKEVPFRQ